MADLNLNTPTLNALVEEFERIRQTIASLPDYLNENAVLKDERERLRERIAYLQSTSEEIALNNSYLKTEITQLKTQIFEAEAMTLTHKTRMKGLEVELDASRSAQQSLREMNDSINKSLNDSEAQREALKAELEAVTKLLETTTAGASG